MQQYILLKFTLGADHLIGGGRAMVFLHDQTFFDSQQTIFLSAIKHNKMFSPFISFDSPDTILSTCHHIYLDFPRFHHDF